MGFWSKLVKALVASAKLTDAVKGGLKDREPDRRPAPPRKPPVKRGKQVQ